MPKKPASRSNRGPTIQTESVQLGERDENKTVSEINDTDDFLQRVHKWFAVAEDASREFRNLAIESLDFLSNRQWNEADAEKRNNDERPTITINKTTSTVMTVAGLQRQARTQIDLKPFEPNDIEATELMQIIYESVAAKSRMHAKSSKVFLDKIGTGLGFWRVSLDTTRNPTGEVRIDRLNSLNVFWDPNFPDTEWEDIEWVMEAPWMTLDEAMATWPKFKEDIRHRFGEWLSSKIPAEKTGDSVGFDRRSFWDPQTQRLRVLHVWYKEIIRSEVALGFDGFVESDPDLVEQLKAEQEEQPVEDHKFSFVTRPVTFIRHAWVLDDILLEDNEAPPGFDRLPIFPSMGYYFREHPIGLVEFMKDPQREKNKRRSDITEIVSRSAHGGWMNKAEGGADRDQLELFANGAVPIIEYEEDPPKRIDQVEVPQAIVYLDQQSDADLRNTVNVNAELLGQTTQSTVSGRAIEARQKGSTVSLESLFDTFDEEESEVARFVINVIQRTMLRDEALRILGALAQDDRQMQQFSKLPELVGGLEADEPGAMDAIDEIFERTWKMQFDVVVTRKPFEASRRRNSFKQLIDLFQTVAQAGQAVPIDIIVETAREAGLVESRIARKWLERIRAQEQAQAEAAAEQQVGSGLPGAVDQLSEVVGASGAIGNGQPPT